MPGLVVDRLELVDVAKQHRQCALALTRAADRALEALLHRAPVGQTGERVLVGEPRHAREQLGPADGHGQLSGHGLEEAHVLTPKARLAGRGGRVDLAPGVTLDHDRHADLRLLAEPSQARGVPRVDTGVVDGVEVGDAVAQQPIAGAILAQQVDLLVRVAVLAGAEVADVDDRAQHSALALPAAHRERRGVQRGAGLLGHGHRLRGSRPGDGLAWPTPSVPLYDLFCKVTGFNGTSVSSGPTTVRTLWTEPSRFGSTRT